MITVTDKGTITYTYDVTGNKLKKVVVDNTVTPTKTTTTDYLTEVVYENDQLQFISQEEGRIHFTAAQGSTEEALYSNATNQAPVDLRKFLSFRVKIITKCGNRIYTQFW